MKTSAGRTMTTLALITLFAAKSVAAGLEKPLVRAPANLPGIHSWAKWPGAPNESANQRNAQAPKKIPNAAGKPVPKPIREELPQTEDRMAGTSATYVTSSTYGDVAVNYELNEGSTQTEAAGESIATPATAMKQNSQQKKKTVVIDGVAHASSLDDTATVNYEVRAPDNRNSLDEYNWQHVNIDSMWFYQHYMYGRNYEQGPHFFYNQFNGDTFTVDFVTYTNPQVDPHHSLEYYNNWFVPRGCEVDFQSPNYNSRLREAMIVQDGSSRIFLMDTSSTLVQADFILMAIAYDDSLRRLAADPLPTALPKGFALHQNYPNPFNAGTTMAFDLPRPGLVTLKVHNILGQEVASWSYVGRAGENTIRWDGKDENGRPLPSGIYICTLYCDLFSGNEMEPATESRKMVRIN